MITPMCSRRPAPRRSVCRSRPKNKNREERMPHLKRAALAAATLVLSSFPALADNCDPVVDSMTVTAKTPYKSTIIGHVIQMPDAKYMQQPDGNWTYVTIDSHDLIEALDQNLKTAHMTCHLD